MSRHADIWAAARDHETFSSAQGLTVNYGELELIGLQDNPPFVMQDPPVHTEFRKLVSRGFTPRQVEAVEPKVREFVIERIERIRANGGGDIVTELFKPLPSMVVAHYLGVPEEDRDQFDGWTEAIVAANTTAGGVAGGLGGLGDALGDMMAYFTALIERRRVEPEDDTVSHLVAAGVGADGDIAGVLSILAFTFTMVTGGNDTTTGMLGGTAQLLHQRPDQRRLLVENPDLIPEAIDEFLRLTSPVQGLARTATRDVTIGDTTIPAGRRVLLLYGSANRDEREYGAGRGRTGRPAPPAQHPDVQPRRPLLPRRRGGPHAVGRRADRAAGAMPGFRGRRVRNRLGRWQLRASTVVRAVQGDELMPGDWLAARRTEVAADRILDAAGELFAVKEAATVGMHEIASAAGCSRATLYRYFENREALYTAYVHRESYRLYRDMTEQITAVVDPRERLIEGMIASLRNVRESPALASWFDTTQRPIGGDMAEQSEVIKALTEAFVVSLAPDEPEVVAHRARWLVRVMTSMLIFPGRDEADERAMFEEFVVPIVVPAAREVR